MLKGKQLFPEYYLVTWKPLERIFFCLILILLG